MVNNVTIFSRPIKLPGIQKAVSNWGRGKGRGSRGGRGRGGKMLGGTRSKKSESEETVEEPLSSAPSVLDDETSDETPKDEMLKEEKPKEERAQTKLTARHGRPFHASSVTRKTAAVQKCTVSLDKKDAEQKVKKNRDRT